jgi:RNA polymerase sigma factor (sigma-70 family)
VKYEPDTTIGGPRGQFPTTRHSQIQLAAGGGPPAREALDGIIAIYWKPAYKHVRIKWNRSNEEAKDLVQGFFTALVEQDILAGFDPGQGRLRTYLRACLDRFVMKQDESANRLKRGGGVASFDFDAAEREIRTAAPSPEDVFVREWEREMFALAIQDLRASCESGEKWERFQIFERYDLAEGDRPTYAELGEEHGIAVTTVTNHLAWARRELRRFLQARLDRS